MSVSLFHILSLAPFLGGTFSDFMFPCLSVKMPDYCNTKCASTLAQKEGPEVFICNSRNADQRG